MRGGFGQRGHERDRGRPAADDHDALARVVEILGPELWMDDLAREAIEVSELGRVPRS